MLKLNSINLGDCLDLLDRVEANSVDLIYLDPPFYSQKTQKLTSKDGQKMYAFEDTWESVLDYKSYIKERLIKAKRVLRTTGSIFLHCDRSASHHLRCALDEVFGESNFQSEIVWTYKRWSNAKKGLLNTHQNIFFYSLTKDFKFNQFFSDYSPTTNIDQILQERSRDSRGKAVYKTDGEGQTVLMKDKKGVPLSDVWDIPYLNPKAKERVNYPTQKPILLLEKIIALVTDEGDTVLDPFCGSGTTLVAAKLSNRNFIGFDQSSEAVAIAKSRIKNPIKSESALLQKGLSTYVNQDMDSVNILKKLGALVVQRNKGIDGFIRTGDELIPIKIKKVNESLKEATDKLLLASKKNNYSKKFLLLNDQDEDIEDSHDDVSIFRNIRELSKEIESLNS